MNETSQTPYASPSADLLDKNDNQKIHEYKRFSAWGVFGLAIITLGIYSLYWLYSRAEKTNSLQEKQIAKHWLIGLVMTTILSFVVELLGDSAPVAILGLVISIGYLVCYVVVAFGIRDGLKNIIKTDLNGILTFFFSSIYLQYKINEAIDNTRSA